MKRDVEPRVFGLEEANALIPRLEGLLAQLEEKHEAFRRRQDELFFEEILSEASPSEKELQKLEEMLGLLEKEIGEIQKLGCLFRHPGQGQVDFLTRKGGEWIYLCWHRGEKEIRFYHEFRSRSFERQPLDGQNLNARASRS